MNNLLILKINFNNKLTNLIILMQIRIIKNHEIFNNCSNFNKVRISL
jgi:hypothetical protein